MPAHVLPSPRVAPLLKWAGGKRQLLDALSAHYPSGFNRYFEPFFGSGAVFFDLFSRGRLADVPVHLSDVNPDLVGCYRVVRDRTADVILALKALEDEHRRDGDRCYYDVRDGRFNPTRLALLSKGPAHVVAAYTPELAAMLIFLNRTGFNGLFRLNRQGAFNVPVGRYVMPRICDAAQLERVASAFRHPRVAFTCRPFHEALADATAGDFVYCDPPYVPLSPTASFANYTASGFTLFDQQRLRRAVVDACQRGAFVVVSNSSAVAVEQEYGSADARRAQLRMTRVPARRAINSRASSRGAVDELIISNVRPDLAGIRPAMLKAPKPRARRQIA